MESRNPSEQDARLIQAAELGDMGEVRRLCDAGAEPGVDGGEAMIRAARSGHGQIVELFDRLGVGASVTQSQDLIAAAEGGHLDIVRLLYDRGRTPNADDSEALLRAVVNGHLEVASFLLRNGGAPGVPYPSFLHSAIQSGKHSMVSLLMDAKWPVDADAPSACVSANSLLCLQVLTAATAAQKNPDLTAWANELAAAIKLGGSHEALAILKHEAASDKPALLANALKEISLVRSTLRRAKNICGSLQLICAECSPLQPAVESWIKGSTELLFKETWRDEDMMHVVEAWHSIKNLGEKLRLTMPNEPQNLLRYCL